MSECCLLIYMTYIPLQLSQISNLNLLHYFTNHRKKIQLGFPKLYFRFKNISLDGVNQTPNIVNNLWCCWVFSIGLFFFWKRMNCFLWCSIFITSHFWKHKTYCAHEHTQTHISKWASKQAKTHTHIPFHLVQSWFKFHGLYLMVRCGKW